MVDGALHAAELRGLDVEHLQHIVGQRVDKVGDAGQRLGGVALGLLQRLLFVCRLWTEGTGDRFGTGVRQDEQLEKTPNKDKLQQIFQMT